MPRQPEPQPRLAYFLAGELVGGLAAFGPNRVAAAALVATAPKAKTSDRAHLMAALMLAESVDADPTNAALWSQYRAALDFVRGLTDGQDDDEDFDKIFGTADLRNAAQR